MPTTTTPRRRGERGEGVISTAIAVLIMALLGAAMWVTFDRIWSDTATNTENQVRIIGADGS
jgi:ferric-dicitrate binding protein FerR (iron transport regulator)